MLHRCYIGVEQVFHRCCIGLSQVVHRCYTGVALVLHRCYIGVEQVFHIGLEVFLVSRVSLTFNLKLNLQLVFRPLKWFSDIIGTRILLQKPITF